MCIVRRDCPYDTTPPHGTSSFDWTAGASMRQYCSDNHEGNEVIVVAMRFIIAFEHRYKDF